MDCGSVEAGVGNIRTHPSTSPRIGPRRRGEDMSRKHWTTLNRLRTGASRYRAKWGLADSAHVSVASQNRRLLTSSIKQSVLAVLIQIVSRQYLSRLSLHRLAGLPCSMVSKRWQVRSIVVFGGRCALPRTTTFQSHFHVQLYMMLSSPWPRCWSFCLC